MTRLVCLLLAALGIAVAGCGSDDDDSSSPAPATVPSTTSTETGQGSAGTKVVKIANFAFSPKTIDVKVGQKIEFENEDGAPHNVVAYSGADFESDTLGTGATFEFTPTAAGTITYECTLHSQMKGYKIEVS